MVYVVYISWPIIQHYKLFKLFSGVDLLEQCNDFFNMYGLAAQQTCQTTKLAVVAACHFGELLVLCVLVPLTVWLVHCHS